MKITTTICAAWLAVFVVGCASDDQARLKGEAKIGRAEAEKIALAQAPNGTIKEAELEKEKGRLIWSFDIAVPGSNDTTEVNVDARTGQVVAVTKESPEQEKKEGKEQK